MPRLIALVEVRYGGISCVPGTPTEEFDATETDALLLKTIGKAKDAPAKEVATKSVKAEIPVMQPSTEPAQGDVFHQAPEEKPTGRRRYLRRDMTAQES
jgi:hypothetical protein